MPDAVTVDGIAGAIFAGLTPQQLTSAKATGKLIPYNWKMPGKDRCTLENYCGVVSKLIQYNKCGIYNKVVI